METSKEEVVSSVEKIIDDIRLCQARWDYEEDIVVFNDEPIGCTIDKKGGLQVNSWLPEFKERLKSLIRQNL